METLTSSIDSASPEFKQNTEHHRALANELKERPARVREGGGEKYRKHQEEQGKLFVRERIERLLDPSSPFLELSALAAYELYDDETLSSGIVTGIGCVSNREAMVVANDASDWLGQ